MATSQREARRRRVMMLSGQIWEYNRNPMQSDRQTKAEYVPCIESESSAIHKKLPDMRRGNTSNLRHASDVGFVRSKRGRFFIDRRKKLGSVLTNEIILHELSLFFEKNFTEKENGRLLDVGAGTKPYSPLYERYFSSCFSFDTSLSPHNIAGVDVIASGCCLPFRSEAFDCILCTEVLEHVPEPVAVLRELNRVLRPGGRIFLTTPFLVPLHEMPYDYFRYTPSALRHMSLDAGLYVETILSKGEYFALALCYAQFPFMKLWQLLSRLLHMPLAHPYNPVIYFTVVLPQLVYLAWWKRMRRRAKESLATKLYEKLSYVTLGYITTFKKNDSCI